MNKPNMKLKKLSNIASLILHPTLPFSFETTFFKPDHFRVEDGDSKWKDRVRWQTMRWQGECLGLRIGNQGTKREPKVQVKVYSQKKLGRKFLNSLKREIVYRFNLDLDLSGFYKVAKKDSKLWKVVQRLKGMRSGHPNSLYEYLIIGIVLQNATVKRTCQMYQALLHTFGTFLEFENQKLWCFWEPGEFIRKEIKEEDLRALKLGYRAKFIFKIDEQFYEGEIDELELRKKSFKEQKEALLKLYGVGPATVWYLLFDVFHRYDFFEHISPWEQKIYSKIFFDRSPDNPVSVNKLLRYFKKYHPYEQLAVNYFWEDLWWRREKGEKIEWLEKLIRI